MKLANEKIICDFSTEHPDSKDALQVLVKNIRKHDWKTPYEIKGTYPKVSIIDGKRAVFNVCGNKYRVTAKIDYENGVVLVEHVDKHEEYNKRRLK